MRSIRCTTLVLAACAAAAGAQTVYRCPGPAGTTGYQQQPCPGGVAIDARPRNLVDGDSAG
ncbi:MAG: DUF4124 domain-containing protein, partial [Burkholderiales bacterium]|nr:DUF4124 domain-containing protein [Burkholderiales bacterium]